MIRISGITARLFIWFFVFVLIFFGTVLILYINIRNILTVSDNIVKKNYVVASASKKMLEQILSMEENEKKYLLMRKPDYLDYYFGAQQAFESGLTEILGIETKRLSISPTWRRLYDEFQELKVPAKGRDRILQAEEPWLPETAINAWIEAINSARQENEADMERANRELNERGLRTVQTGLVGLGIAILVGLFGGVVLSRAMSRPLGALLRGIRSVSRDRPVEPIPISADEFGELARSFNEMGARLMEEQRMRSDFISMLSHEIRTPLTSIRESVNLIGEGLMGDINDRQRRFLEIAGYEMGRVSELLNRIMQVSYLESGELELHPVSLDTGPFVDLCVENCRPAAEAKNIGIVTRLAPDLPPLMGDADYLRQVFINLVGNAIKFSPPGSEVVVEAAADSGRSELRFSVMDAGPGIPEDDAPFIFNKYYRARSVRDRTDGAGLGLSIARHIVDTHGGTIRAANQEGGGAVFTFTLPLQLKS